jgi:hypothetical protein
MGSTYDIGFRPGSNRPKRPGGFLEEPRSLLGAFLAASAPRVAQMPYQHLIYLLNRARPGSGAHSALRGWSQDGGSTEQTRLLSAPARSGSFIVPIQVAFAYLWKAVFLEGLVLLVTDDLSRVFILCTPVSSQPHMAGTSVLRPYCKPDQDLGRSKAEPTEPRFKCLDFEHDLDPAQDADHLHYPDPPGSTSGSTRIWMDIYHRSRSGL